jgi:secreted PhoX family phosphatase
MPTLYRRDRFRDIGEKRLNIIMKRRHFLAFLGIGTGSVLVAPFNPMRPNANRAIASEPEVGGNILKFQPIQGAMPLDYVGLSSEEQMERYSAFRVLDDLVLPEGYTYDVLASWGEPVGDSHFGYNNDYLSLVETGSDEGYLTVNFEYISALPWSQSYEQVMGKALSLDAVKAAVEAAGESGIDAFSLPDGDSLKAQIRDICQAAMVDVGIGVISIQKGEDGRWSRTYSHCDRRITGISGLEDERYLRATGPAIAVFNKTSGIGYLDGLGDRLIGTLSNCAGGTTPWGTVFSAEENFQNYLPEAVYADGTSMPPSAKPFSINTEEIVGLGNVFGLAGNKYGWMVEVDPANPTDYGVKHTWLGRYRHEAVAIRAEAGKALAIYSGCDRRGGHLYKFVSDAMIHNPQDKANSRLLESGMLYAAKFHPDGTGEWIPLSPDTPVNPDLPSVHVGGMIPLPNRPDGGVVKVTDDAVAIAFKSQFHTLGDLYDGNPTEQQGAILIDAHFAANAAGATCTARPEDTDLAANGSLFMTFTSGASSSSDGGPDARIFKGPNGESAYEYGWIMRLDETDNNPAAMTFVWAMFAAGGEPAEGGLGFANPDNLEFDAQGNLWMVTDMSTDKHNVEVASRIGEDGSPVSQSNLRGLFGNNSIWFLPTQGENAGEAYLFGYGPMECEMTGPFMTSDVKTLFLSAQHPGEMYGIRQNMAYEMRRFAMKTTDGEEFMQTRVVPMGSNWPSKAANEPPKPSVVVVRRLDGEALA